MPLSSHLRNRPATRRRAKAFNTKGRRALFVEPRYLLTTCTEEEHTGCYIEAYFSGQYEYPAWAPVPDTPTVPGSITVCRYTDDGNYPDAVDVDYAIVGGTATPGVDFSNPSGHVTVPLGQQCVSDPITLFNDPWIEDDETVIMQVTGYESHADPPLVYDYSGTTTGYVISNDEAGRKRAEKGVRLHC